MDSRLSTDWYDFDVGAVQFFQYFLRRLNLIVVESPSTLIELVPKRVYLFLGVLCPGILAQDTRPDLRVISEL